jgi:hypothetical protein
LAAVLDTKEVADGPHQVTFAVRDAAGNETSTDPFQIVVNNAVIEGAANGVAATRFAKLSARFGTHGDAASRTVNFGAPSTLSGTLASVDGAPIAGATVAINRTLNRPNSPAESVATVVTAADGSFRYSLPASPSAVFSLGYTAFSNDPAPIASAQLKLAVRAGVTLQVVPRRVRNGSVVTFRGRLRGGPGKRRSVITLYAVTKGARSRIPVETVTADSGGRFEYKYRFRSIAGPTRFRFQAVVPRQSGYPYASGKSAIQVVHARP